MTRTLAGWLALNGINPDPNIMDRPFGVLPLIPPIPGSLPTLFGMTFRQTSFMPPYKVLIETGNRRTPYYLVDLRKKPRTDDMRQMLIDLKVPK